MTSRVTAVLAEYAQREHEERVAIFSFDDEICQRQREKMLLGIGPDSGQLLSLLIRSQRPRCIVEAGTAFGYSTLWLADAAASVGGRVISLEIAAEKQEYAAMMMRKAGLEDSVKFIQGDALEWLGAFSPTVDFALIELWKDVYIPAFDLLYPKLSNGAIVCADSMLFPDYQRSAASEYIAHARSHPGIQSVTLDIGSGLEFSRFDGTAQTVSSSAL